MISEGDGVRERTSRRVDWDPDWAPLYNQWEEKVKGNSKGREPMAKSRLLGPSSDFTGRFQF